MHQKTCADMVSQEFTNINNQLSQFELTKLIYTSKLLSKVKLTPTAKLILIALSNHYNPDKKTMYPSQKYLASQLGVSERTVKRAIQELANSGLVIYETKKVNQYKFTSIFFNILQPKPVVDNSSRCKNGTSEGVKMSPKQIKEEKNKSFYKNDFSTKKRPYEHFNHVAGVQYKPYEVKKLIRDDKSPMNDKQTAIKYIESFNEDELKSAFIKKQVDRVIKKWKL